MIDIFDFSVPWTPPWSIVDNSCGVFVCLAKLRRLIEWWRLLLSDTATATPGSSKALVRCDVSHLTQYSPYRELCLGLIRPVCSQTRVTCCHLPLLCWTRVSIIQTWGTNLQWTVLSPWTAASTRGGTCPRSCSEYGDLSLEMITNVNVNGATFNIWAFLAESVWEY